MNFLVRPGVPFYGRQLQERALASWRAAADVVWARWEVLIEASPECRAAAFRRYLDALDAEAGAAAALADIHIRTVA